MAQSFAQKSRVRGTTSLELLITLPIVFLMFLGTAQLALLGMARLVVQHAAHRAARAAIVILDDDPSEYDDAERGDLGADEPNQRMTAIRKAAGWPLSVLALPPEAILQAGLELPVIGTIGADGPLGGLTVEGAVRTGLLETAAGLLFYNDMAAALTLEKGGAPATLFSPTDDVTAHLYFLAPCRIPLASRLICKSYAELIKDEAVKAAIQNVPQSDWQEKLEYSALRFMVVEAKETLPNQGATYHDTPAAQPEDQDNEEGGAS